jgi:hypothetical protein
MQEALAYLGRASFGKTADTFPGSARVPHTVPRSIGEELISCWFNRLLVQAGVGWTLFLRARRFGRIPFGEASLPVDGVRAFRQTLNTTASVVWGRFRQGF